MVDNEAIVNYDGKNYRETNRDDQKLAISQPLIKVFSTDRRCRVCLPDAKSDFEDNPALDQADTQLGYQIAIIDVHRENNLHAPLHNYVNQSEADRE